MRRHPLLWTLVLCLTALVVASASAAPVAVEAPAPASGPAGMRKVDVGGFRLAIYCRGKGTPTVVLESGVGFNSGTWLGVEPRIARTTRVCSYDRAGLGYSDARRPAQPTAPVATVVKELHALLRSAGLSRPYVLGGSGAGGFFNRLYAKRYPAEVAGLVSVDGTPIGLPSPDRPPIDPWAGWGRGPSPESLDFAAADAELAAAPGLGARPFVVLTSAPGPPLETRWLKWQKRLARLSTSSMLVRADLAQTGPIQANQPDLTAEAFRLVVVAVRKSARLPRCAATKFAKSLFGTCL